VRRTTPILFAALLLAVPTFSVANRPRSRTARPATYEIRPGDTLSEIAERFSIPPEDLVRANRLEGDGSTILAGEELVIPGDGDGDEEPIRFRLPADPSRMRIGSGEMAIWLIVRPPTRALLRAAGRGPRVPERLRWPVKSHRIGRGFGSGRSCRHFALDIPAPLEERVRAAAGGYVAYSGPFRGYGNTVLLVHPGGAVTLYAHLTTALARLRTKVRRGQNIGLSGSTGVSRGPHLHFALFVDGKPVDAAPYMHPEPSFNGGRYGCVPPEASDLVASD
jgi:murein DD-endopeptidase MepM/ murein hydrolase activator NlpD